MNKQEEPKKITNAKPIPHIPLPFKEVMKDVLKVKPPQKTRKPCECGCGQFPKRGRFVRGHVLKKVFKENH